MTDEMLILEAQLRECYGRAVYTHKTQEACADLALERLRWIKFWQVVLSALVTGGILTTLVTVSPAWKVAVSIVSAVLSTGLLALNTYAKDRDLGEVAQKHRQAAADIWLIRESYLSLLVDLRNAAASQVDIRQERKRLMEALHATYRGAPSTHAKAYIRAQNALKNLEDMTFSDAELDKLLPNPLKRTTVTPGSGVSPGP